ncbi:hypothetical protein J6590_019446 [Homalodisca vitripennis]|nr:hypothetical protein J6590_019446 [Homalodisca vitripennis]
MAALPPLLIVPRPNGGYFMDDPPQKPDQLGDTHSYDTRNAYDYALPTHHLTLFEKKPTYMGRKLFNQLPEDLKRRRDEKYFKTALKAWLLQKPYYTLEEFLNT